MPYYPSRPDPEPSAPPPSPRRKIKIPRRLVLCVSAFLIVYGLVRLVIYGADLHAARQTTQQLREIAAEPTAAAQAASAAPETAAGEALPSADPSPEASAPPPSPTPAAAEAEKSATAPSPALPPSAPASLSARADRLPAVDYPNGYELVPRIQKLRKASRYVIGWITMDSLDEPVVLKDNVFFLDHDPNGRHNSNGAIFMDESTPLLTRPYTILLYGHNMKSGAMFGNLRKYEDSAYCFRHRIFRFDTLYEEGEYAIFAVTKVNLVPGRRSYVSFPDLQSLRPENRRSAIRSLTENSMHETLLDVNEEDQLLLLVTCVGNDDERLVVAARRLRAGESADSLTMKKP